MHCTLYFFFPKPLEVSLVLCHCKGINMALIKAGVNMAALLG